MVVHTAPKDESDQQTAESFIRYPITKPSGGFSIPRNEHRTTCHARGAQQNPPSSEKKLKLQGEDLLPTYRGERNRGPVYKVESFGTKKSKIASLKMGLNLRNLTN